MPTDAANPAAEILFFTVLALAVWAFIVTWTFVIKRMRRRKPVIAYRPRRTAPWRAIDLAMVALIFLVLQSCVFFLAREYLGPDAMRAPSVYNPEEATTQHTLLQLINGGNVWVLLTCGFSAIVAAPIAEEFLFRVVLQGWLESLEHRYRRRMPTLRRWFPRAFLPVAVASFLFAMMHFRTVGAPMNERLTVFLLAGNAVVGLLTLALTVGFLKWSRGATVADFGWSPRTFFRDVWLGLVSFAAVIIPLFALQLALISILPKYVSADPIALFFFATILGTLYYRTHSAMPSIVLHAALNATSFTMVLLQSSTS